MKDGTLQLRRAAGTEKAESFPITIDGRVLTIDGRRYTRVDDVKTDGFVLSGKFESFGTHPAFLTGAVAISGLPPLNGFAGEFLIYLRALQGGGALPGLAAIVGLALVGGLAAACFAKAFGIVDKVLEKRPEEG